MCWPDYFPQGCPPVDSEGAVGEVFIFVSNDKEIDASFTCKKVRFPDEEYKDECMACGLSVSRSLEDAERSRKRVYFLRKKKLCAAVLEEEIGKIKHTPVSRVKKHYTWWIPSWIDCPWGHFVDIDDY